MNREYIHIMFTLCMYSLWSTSDASLCSGIKKQKEMKVLVMRLTFLWCLGITCEYTYGIPFVYDVACLALGTFGRLGAVILICLGLLCACYDLFFLYLTYTCLYQNIFYIY